MEAKVMEVNEINYILYITLIKMLTLGVLAQSKFGKKLFCDELDLPPHSILPNSTETFPHFFIGDSAFPLKKNLMRPYPGKCLPIERKIFNYRISRARVVIENAFGILVARWRILRTTLNCRPENAEKVSIYEKVFLIN